MKVLRMLENMVGGKGWVKVERWWDGETVTVRTATAVKVAHEMALVPGGMSQLSGVTIGERMFALDGVLYTPTHESPEPSLKIHQIYRRATGEVEGIKVVFAPEKVFFEETPAVYLLNPTGGAWVKCEYWGRWRGEWYKQFCTFSHHFSLENENYNLKLI